MNLPLGALVLHRCPRSNAALVARVCGHHGPDAMLEVEQHGTGRRTSAPAASLVTIDAARSALDRARHVGRQLGTAPLAIGHADALAAYITHLEDRLTATKEAAMPFVALWAAQYAAEHGLPDKHMFAGHYDLLADLGARMCDFVRHDDRTTPHARGEGAAGAVPGVVR